MTYTLKNCKLFCHICKIQFWCVLNSKENIYWKYFKGLAQKQNLRRSDIKYKTMNIIFVKWLTKQSALNFVSVRDYYYRFSLSQTSNTGAVLNLSSGDFANVKQQRLTKHVITYVDFNISALLLLQEPIKKFKHAL